LVLDPDRLRRAVDLQRRSHALLHWLAEAIDRGFIDYDAAQSYATTPATTLAWLERHRLDVPAAARPEPADLVDFCRLFTTYLATSFELLRAPGRRLHSPDAHCFCPMCSWFEDAPRLRAKKLRPADKRRADRLELSTARALSGDDVSEADLAALRADPALAEALAKAAWARELLHRLEGVSEGPATLALYRRFAWHRAGSPKAGFTVDADDLLAAVELLRQGLSARRRDVQA
jgi:hypothetical protein